MPVSFKAPPHKDRLTALWHICLHIFRHLTHKFFDIRQYACEIYAQSAEKSDCSSAPQSLCGVALIKYMLLFDKFRKFLSGISVSILGRVPV